jgi:CRISPR-associated protein Cas5t
LFLLLSGFIRKDSYKNLQGGTIESKIVQAGRNMKYIGQNLLFFINFQEVLNMNSTKGLHQLGFLGRKETKETLQRKRKHTEKA